MFERLGPHAGFILWSYAAAIILIGGLSLWIAARHRAAKRRLAAQETARARHD
jgi:heme exporter protein D